jgi:hypothetical protein
MITMDGLYSELAFRLRGLQYPTNQTFIRKNDNRTMVSSAGRKNRKYKE